MSTPGLSSSDKPYKLVVILLLLSATGLLIYQFLKNRIFTLIPNQVNKDTAQTVYSLFQAYGFNVQQAQWFTAQAAHETAGFTSDVFKKYKNCFGFKLPDASDYKTYNDISDSCDDVRKWYNKRRNNIFSLPLIITSLKDYVHFLKDGHYFEASETEYYNGCLFYYNNLFSGIDK
jgi:hypothetical protein